MEWRETMRAKLSSPHARSIARHAWHRCAVASGREARDRLAVARRDPVAVFVLSLRDNRFAADDDGLDQRCPRDEHVSVERRRDATGEIRMRRIEHDDVGALASLDPADRAAEGLRTARESLRIKLRAGRLALVGDHVAGAKLEPL